jgi:alkylated DNA nucleotide flippase Atl1
MTTTKPSTFNADVMAMIHLVRAGEWTSSKAIATAVGRPHAYRSVGNVVGPQNWTGSADDRAYAVRVLHDGGRVSPQFRILGDPGSGPHTAVAMLERQGLTFAGGRADRARFVSADMLAERFWGPS